MVISVHDPAAGRCHEREPFLPSGGVKRDLMRDCLVLVDLFDDFAHEDGEALLASFRERLEGISFLLSCARDRQLPVIYANDPAGVFDGDVRRIVARARAAQPATE